MDDERTPAQLLGATGPFARALPRFAPRAVQQTMADAVAQAMAGGQALVVEAGTGTGKTFAYLVPALLAGQRVIVSTGTKALQDQLFHRDIPRVRQVLGTPLKAALLKGRANYLCRYRLQQALQDPPPAGSALARDLAEVARWAEATREGDRMELTAVAEDSPVWPRVTSTVDNCLGTECPLYDECHLYRARRKAMDADLVVVNHHLLLADMALKIEGHGEILPEAAAFILDEAHQIPALAGQFFSRSVSSRQVRELVKDCYSECGEVPAALATLQEPLGVLDALLKKALLAMQGLPERGTLAAVERDRVIWAGLRALAEGLGTLAAVLEPLAAGSRGLDAVHARAALLHNRLAGLLGMREDGPVAEDVEGVEFDQAGWSELDDETDTAPEVRWYEVSRYGFALSITPLDLATPLRRIREASDAAWVFTSATLSVAGDFGHFIQRMGLAEPRTLALDSPFDYRQQALLYLPPDLPDPRQPDYTERMVAAARPVLEAAGGRSFMLFTSHQALRRAEQLLRDTLPYPLLVQGSRPRNQLLEAFRAAGNAVLLGAASFWEGVDVAGEALSCVIIDKLPFAAPGDPVGEARREALRVAGGNPFTQLQVPEAVIALKQGCGRLLRDVDDRGVLMLCDPRLLGKGYGRRFLDSLPPMPRTQELGAVQAFFAAAEGSSMRA